MPGLLASRTDATASAVLIVSDIFGRSPFYEDLAVRLTTAGYHTLLPDLFFRQGPLPERTREAAFARRDKLDENQVIGDLCTAIDWLTSQPGTRRGQVGTVGFCMGGTLVLDLAAQRNDLATVCYYGFVAGDKQSKAKLAPTPLEAIDRLSGPIIGFWGDQDVGVGIPNVLRFAEELRERRVPFEYVLYPGLAHGFLAACGWDPNHVAYEAATDSWSRSLSFYREHLGAPER
jgi:carboxymethylenebutenolidase